MNTALNPLGSVKSLLQEIVRTDDAARFAKCLGGKYLPALGGHQHPAEILHQALSLPPFVPELPTHLAALLAMLCRERALILSDLLKRTELASMAVGAQGPVAVVPTATVLLDDEPYVFNLFLFASYLPAHDNLFAALKEFHQIGLHTAVLLIGGGRAARQLRRALTYQQVDSSLEEQWFSLIHHYGSSPLTAEEKSDFLDAWTALLWIPPTPADREAGRTLAIERVVRGLRALYDAARDIEGLPLLRYAVRQLSEAYPRSPEFWSDQLAGHVEGWPDLLRAVLQERWPALAPEEVDDNLIPAEARAVWQALGAEQRALIQDAAASSDPIRWSTLWTNLVFTPPSTNLPPQETIRMLQKIRSAFQLHFSGLTAATPESFDDLIASDKQGMAETRGKRFSRRTSTLAAFERVTNVIATIKDLLQRGDLRKARQFLDDQIRHQETETAKPELRVKTLCNAAASALEHGHQEWARELYEKAIAYAVNDPVPHSGLAEVLKAKDDLTGAETLYRETISRWPNDVVAHTGLANVLRKQRRFAEALSLLPEPAMLRSRQNRVNLHLHGMILLDSGDVERAILIFERGLAAGPGPRQQAYYRSALIVAQLRQQRYREALQELEVLPESQPELVALRLHALAGDGQEQKACELHNDLSAKIWDFRRPVRMTLQRIDEAYGLASAAGPRRPTQSQFEDVISAEIEMLAAA